MIFFDTDAPSDVFISRVPRALFAVIVISTCPVGMYLVKIDFERGVSAMRKAIKNAELRMVKNKEILREDTSNTRR